MSDISHHKELHELMNIGEALLHYGADVNRVEDTLSRMASAFGAETVNIFVITSYITVTAIFTDGKEITQTRRIKDTGTTDFRVVEELNELSRNFCNKPFSLPELHEKTSEILGKKPDRIKLYIGSFLAAWGFSLFFGGSIAESLISGVVAFLVCFAQEKIAPVFGNSVVFNFFIMFILGIFLSSIIPFAGMEKGNILVGEIMLLIPGIAITNSFRDMLVGDTISGLLRLVYSVLSALGLALGYISAVSLMGVIA